MRDLNELQDATGVSGELDVRVKAPDLTDPATLRWMAGFKHRVLTANGFTGPNPSCLDGRSLPGPALSDFVVGGGGPLRRARGPRRPAPNCRRTTSTGGARRPEDRPAGAHGAAQLRDPRPVARRPAGADRARPRGDRRAGRARRAAAGRRGRARRPAGGRGRGGERPLRQPLLARPSPACSRSRSSCSVAYRSLARALVPLAPVVLAGGWSALVLWASGIPLNPMSAALGGADDRDRDRVQRHPLGALPRGAGRRARGSPRRCRPPTRAPARPCSPRALTATAGFAVLIASDIRMLRDFGLVTVIDLAVALLGVMVALPAALALWGGGAMRDRYSIARRPALRRGRRDRGPQRDRRRRRHARPRPPAAALAAAGVRGARCAGSTLEGDANVAQDDCETSQLPCPPDARRTPACRVARRGARSASATSSTGPR